MVNINYLCKELIGPVKSGLFKAAKNANFKGIKYAPRELANDCYTASKNATKEIVEHFHPKKGAKLPIDKAKQVQIAGRVTPNIEEQKLIMKMVENESVVVTEAAEKTVMRTQFGRFMEKYPKIQPKDIYVYSPQPKGKIKSYTRSGEIFAETNNIDKTHIRTNFKDIPKDATVFMPDDCSITGSSMVFDLLEHMPKDFQGRIILAPTVKGSGVNMNGDPMADKVLELFSKMNSKTTQREQIVEDLTNLISDNKLKNKEALNELLNPSNYSNARIEIADGSLAAKNFRATETFAAMNKTEQRLVDALFTASGINKGYHSSGVMVLLPNKTPNNNVGIMELYADAMGLAGKPNGILKYSENIELMNNGQRCAIGMTPMSNNHGNYKQICVEIPSTGQVHKIPFNSKTDGPLDVTIKLPNGEIQTIKYKAKLEDKEKLSEGRLFGFEIGESLQKLIKAFKGHYQPKSVEPHFGYYSDVLAIPQNAEIISIGGLNLNKIA